MTDYAYKYDEATIKIKKLKDEFSLLSLKETDKIGYQKYQTVLRKFFVKVPPSGAVAGLIIKNDDLRGPWIAAGNIPFTHVVTEEIVLSDHDQETLNSTVSEKSINCIRSFFNRGITIWGGRTLGFVISEFKYYTARRFSNLLQNDVKNSLAAFTTKNITESILILKNNINNYLYHFFKRGVFPGTEVEIVILLNVV